MSPSESNFLWSVKLALTDPRANTGATLAGGCLCAGVRFTYRGVLGGRLGPATLCHCAQCRKAQGYASAAVPVQADGFALVEGRDLICEYASSPDKVRAFCRRCGSPLYSRRLSLPQVLRLRLGSLDAAPLDLAIEAHIFCEDEPAWSKADGAGRYPGLEPHRGESPAA